MNPKFTAEIQVQGDSLPRKKVSLTSLKAFAETLPHDWPCREILMAESEELDVSTFLARLPVWLRLIKLGRRRY